MEREEYLDKIEEAFDKASDSDKIEMLEDIYEPLSDLVMDNVDKMSEDHFLNVLHILDIELVGEDEDD